MDMYRPYRGLLGLKVAQELVCGVRPIERHHGVPPPSEATGEGAVDRPPARSPLARQPSRRSAP
jgi:hypothetical protein